MAPTREHRRKVAIIGSGCAGLGAAWALRNTDYEVHVFEKSHKLGGHTNTQPFHAGGTTVQVDTGFIVMNAATYPNFIRFLKEVGVDPVDSEMTFSVSRDNGAFEWSGEAKGIFAQRRNLFRLRHWRMIFDIIRFNQFALDLLADDDEGVVTRLGTSVSGRKHSRDMTIGQYLEKEGYSRAFRDDYLIPMTAAVWSTSPDKTSLEFPAHTLVRFMWNHHLLSTLAVRPPWLTIDGGSQRYIDAIIKGYPAGKLHLHTSCEVTNIVRPSATGETGVTVSWIDNKSGRIEGDMFHHAIMATHGDDVLPLLTKNANNQETQQTNKKASKKSASLQNGLQTVSQEERDVFSAFQTTENICYLHSDMSLMPRREATWSAWNYLTHSSPKTSSYSSAVSLTYCMNILQHLKVSNVGPVLVTMNPRHPPARALTQGEFIYRHPLYTVEAVNAQKRLPALQNTRGVSYCGAWTKYGFHEDGFSSGLKVAMDHLGAKLPFEFVDSTFSRGHKPVLCWKDYVLRAVLLLLTMWISVIEFFLGLPVIRTFVPLVEFTAAKVLDTAELVGLLKDPVAR